MPQAHIFYKVNRTSSTLQIRHSSLHIMYGRCIFNCIHFKITQQTLNATFHLSHQAIAPLRIQLKSSVYLSNTPTPTYSDKQPLEPMMRQTNETPPHTQALTIPAHQTIETPTHDTHRESNPRKQSPSKTNIDRQQQRTRERASVQGADAPRQKNKHTASAKAARPPSAPSRKARPPLRLYVRITLA
ncbi:uncharacterized protein K452DRAFT_11945 [Aplosporella prunicola CBS 121167]|uniref:Uncharacterized protein n=1 Tax=Aplosporella prunicola CBS 121167 TaxID=1176127 RepID=A0A6A6BJ77_9PEZI|nr:uncharacterized protein K452DRAFT_11945 [Aplosporella prunicola CBS 121167]KAF2142867.1 hypothetical protein K452DRAFT_11945 [Aplosporella prunicola CBS 121167]